MNKQNVFDYMDEHGIVRARLSFSGGNDEGGFDGVGDYTDTEGDLHEVGWQDNHLAALEGLVGDALYDKWGSFAGDFNVHGDLILDADNKKISLKYSETEYVPHEVEL